MRKLHTWFVPLLLVLAGCLGSRKAPEPDLDAGLDVDWIVVSLGDEALELPEGTEQPYLRFPSDKPGAVLGNTGCNQLFGSYMREEDDFQFGELATTRRACPGLDLETRFLAALGEVDRYVRDGDVVTLFAGERTVAVLNPRPEPVPEAEPES